jgi:hypothetical protein
MSRGFNPGAAASETECREFDRNFQSEGDKPKQKTILVTGSTDGIGFETAGMLVSLGHHVLHHGRNPSKLEETAKNALRAGGRRAH